VPLGSGLGPSVIICPLGFCSVCGARGSVSEGQCLQGASVQRIQELCGAIIEIFGASREGRH